MEFSLSAEQRELMEAAVCDCLHDPFGSSGNATPPVLETGVLESLSLGGCRG
jgi:hypothetical protein